MDLKHIEKMLRAVLAGQSSLKQELKSEIQKLDRELSKKLNKINKILVYQNKKLEDISARLEQHIASV